MASKYTFIRQGTNTITRIKHGPQTTLTRSDSIKGGKNGSVSTFTGDDENGHRIVYAVKETHNEEWPDMYKKFGTVCLSTEHTGASRDRYFASIQAAENLRSEHNIPIIHSAIVQEIPEKHDMFVSCKPTQVMEQMDGDVDELLRLDTFHTDNRLQLALVVLDALYRMYNLGYSYLDMKPANVLYRRHNRILTVALGDLEGILPNSVHRHLATFPPLDKQLSNGVVHKGTPYTLLWSMVCFLIMCIVPLDRAYRLFTYNTYTHLADREADLSEFVKDLHIHILPSIFPPESSSHRITELILNTLKPGTVDLTDDELYRYATNLLQTLREFVSNQKPIVIGPLRNSNKRFRTGMSRYTRFIQVLGITDNRSIEDLDLEQDVLRSLGHMELKEPTEAEIETIWSQLDNVGNNNTHEARIPKSTYDLCLLPTVAAYQELLHRTGRQYDRTFPSKLELCRSFDLEVCDIEGLEENHILASTNGIETRIRDITDPITKTLATDLLRINGNNDVYYRFDTLTQLRDAVDPYQRTLIHTIEHDSSRYRAVHDGLIRIGYRLPMSRVIPDRFTLGTVQYSAVMGTSNTWMMAGVNFRLHNTRTYSNFNYRRRFETMDRLANHTVADIISDLKQGRGIPHSEIIDSNVQIHLCTRPTRARLPGNYRIIYIKIPQNEQIPTVRIEYS